jgi:hypothetical protein
MFFFSSTNSIYGKTNFMLNKVPSQNLNSLFGLKYDSMGQLRGKPYLFVKWVFKVI